MNLDNIDINCDLGEGIAWEKEIFPYINSCSIACGGHYGNEESMASTMEQAISYNVNAGAHPSYPDKDNFGRLRMKLTEDEFKSSLKSQLDGYFSVLNKFQIKNHHVKAHGALYNDLMQDVETGIWFLEVVQYYDYGSIYTPYNGVLALLARERKMEVTFEAFIDRSYDMNGMLVSRSIPNAVKDSPDEIWEQLYDIVAFQRVKTIEGLTIPIKANTFCIHGDHPTSLKTVQFIRRKLNDMQK